MVEDAPADDLSKLSLLIRRGGARAACALFRGGDGGVRNETAGSRWYRGLPPSSALKHFSSERDRKCSNDNDPRRYCLQCSALLLCHRSSGATNGPVLSFALSNRPLFISEQAITFSPVSTRNKDRRPHDKDQYALNGGVCDLRE
jgi:hypothetical protein